MLRAAMLRRLTLSLLLAFSSLSVASAVATGPPQTLTALVTGSTVTLTWLPPETGGAPTSYVVEAALSPGGALIASLPVTGISVAVPGVPNGVYYVRVRAVDGDGAGPPSNEVIVAVPGGANAGCSSPPNPPQNLTGSATGSQVTLSWNPPVAGCAAASYAVQAGSGTGLSDVTVANVGAASTLSSAAPTGTYFIRVIALNAFGGSAASNEVVVRVGVVTPTPPPPPAPTPPAPAPTPPPSAFAQFAVSTTASLGWTSIEVFANGNSIGTLTRFFEPGAPASCVAIPGARVVASVPPGTVTYSARSNVGGSWNGTTQASAGSCIEIQLTCTNRDCSPAPPPPPSSAVYHVWGGPGYSQYLGFFTCTFCREFGSDSINNEFGRYGSQFSSTSIRNQFSQYGSEFSSNSACNGFASNPPRVFNASRSVYYGELTLNRFRSNAVEAWTTWLAQDVCSH